MSRVLSDTYITRGGEQLWKTAQVLYVITDVYRSRLQYNNNSNNNSTRMSKEYKYPVRAKGFSGKNQ